MDYTDAQVMTGYADIPATAGSDMSPAGIAIFLIIGIALYIYSAYCLMQIAKKTNTPNEWMAWIPIANIVLMLNIARLPLWWLAGFILAFIPVVNLLTIVLAAYIWWKIAEQRRRPGWWGILMLIGPVNLVLLYFLAFREAPNQVAPVPAAEPAPTQTPPTTPAA